MTGRSYGPTASGKSYLAVSYHQRNARKNPNKSRWKITEPHQYDVFVLSDGNKLHFPSNDVLVGLARNCEQQLGCDDERLAKFVAPAVGSSEWHGFPVFSKEFDFSEEFLDTLEERKLIDRRTRNRIVKCKL
ncbi:MAG: hypothetical protein ACD_51C00166G0002 [uncultured bacterium]|nr:MAG: hypothetical protein ACD_51C00166G0002 [uncultured bacterium]